MSSDYISVGFTHVPGTVTRDAAMSAVSKYVPTLVKDLDVWDTEDNVFVGDLEDVTGAVTEALQDGIDAAFESIEYGADAPIGNTGRVYITRGGESWGDVPFDGFTNLCALLEAIWHVPEMGREISILGAGIVLD